MKYTAELFRNTREVVYHDFDAKDDAAARKYIISHTESCDIDWIDREDSDADCDTGDRTISLYRGDPTWNNAIEEGITLKSEMPYSMDAREFVRRVAKTGLGFTQHEAAITLQNLIHEARKLCGEKE